MLTEVCDTGIMREMTGMSEEESVEKMTMANE